MFGFGSPVEHADLDFIGIYRFDGKRKLRRKRGKKTVPVKGMRRVELLSPAEVSAIGTWAVEKMMKGGF